MPKVVDLELFCDKAMETRKVELNKRHFIITIMTLSMIMMSGLVWAVVRHPEPLTVPAVYDFSAIPYESKIYPDWIVGWKVGTNPTQTYKTNAPADTLALKDRGKASNYTAGIYNYDGKIGMLNSLSYDNAIAFAVVTTDKSNIRVTYDMMTMRSPVLRSNRAVLQYRIGDTGVFTTIPESEYFSSDARQVTGTDPLNVQTISVILPPTCNDQELVQLRFVSRDESDGNLHRSSFAINNLSVDVSAGAYMTMVPSSILGMGYDLGDGPSEVQSFTLNASDLSDDVTLQVQGEFEISLSEDGAYSNTLNLTQSSDPIVDAKIYVRFKEVPARGHYLGSITIRHGLTDYPTKIFLSGRVEEPLDEGYFIDFEDVEKKIFDPADLLLNELKWNLNEVLITDHYDDFRNDVQAARFSGKAESSMTMLEDKINGLATLRFYYGRHSTNKQVDWKVEYSRDQGRTWIQIGDVFVCPANDTVQEFRETVNVPGNVRIRISRGTMTFPGSSHGKFSIDDILLTHYDGYDIYPNSIKAISDNTSAVISGTGFFGANIIFSAPEDLSAFPNDEFIPDTRGKWELFGSGDATISVSTDKDWFAWLENGIWHALEGPFEDTQIVINIDAVDAAGGTMFEFMTGSGDNPSLPVELSSFTVALNAKGKPIISWTTQSETAMNGFYVYRSMNRTLADAILISGLIPATNSSLTQIYSFEDTDIYEKGVYYYWLNMSDLNGHESYLGPTQLSYSFEEASTPEMVYQTRFKSVYPNPFNPSTNIAFELSGKSEVDIKVYNTRGQLVRSFAPFTHDAGQGSIVWDGKDDGGRQASSGIYFFRMKIGAKSYNAKALMLK